MKLLRDLVLILPLAGKSQTSSGIVIASIDKTAPAFGVVVATGPGGVNDAGAPLKVGVKPGETVAFMRNGQGVEQLEVDGDKLLVVPHREILAVIEHREELC